LSDKKMILYDLRVNQYSRVRKMICNNKKKSINIIGTAHMNTHTYVM